MVKTLPCVWENEGNTMKNEGNTTKNKGSTEGTKMQDRDTEKRREYCGRTKLRVLISGIVSRSRKNYKQVQVVV
jgi:hypothetical protein